jgi:hypothetical protein
MLYPGVDLLIAANWDSVVMGYYEMDFPLPELSGVMPEVPVKPADTNAVAPADTAVSSFAESTGAATAEEPHTLTTGAQERKLRGLGVMVTTTVMFVVIGLVVALGTLAVSWRRRTQL